LAVYWQVQGHAFVTFDDYQYVVENPHVRHGLTLQGIVWAFTSGYASNWHPLTWLSHMLDCTLYGLNPKGHHFNNLLLHLTNTLLLFWVLRRMTTALWRSAFVAALFALHPLHVESVAWVAERKDLLSTLFWMMTMGAYALYVERPGLGRYLFTLHLFALGLLAKPMLVTFPFVLLLLDYWPLGRRHQSPFLLMREKLPFFALTMISSVITFCVQKSWGAVIVSIPLKDRIANALVAYVTYIGKMIWPANLACFYPHPLDTLPLWQVGGSLLLLAGISIFAIRARQRRPYLPVGWFWYLGTLVPVIGLVQVGAQAMADRYTYVPLIGLFLVIAWTVADISSKWLSFKRPLHALATIGLCSLAGLSLLQVRHWKDSITLFQHNIRVTTNNHLAHFHLGRNLEHHGDLREALVHFHEALRLRPDFSLGHYAVGNTLSKLGEVNAAIDHLSRALELDPDLTRAHNNLGCLLIRQGNIKAAAHHFTEALRIDPGDRKARRNLDIAHRRMGSAGDQQPR
jgi:tetratricopeptide (TPR) repeat protein